MHILVSQVRRNRQPGVAQPPAAHPVSHVGAEAQDGVVAHPVSQLGAAIVSQPQTGCPHPQAGAAAHEVSAQPATNSILLSAVALPA